MATASTTTYQQAARALLRDTLLDAAADLMTDAPWTELSMAAIATRAGVSRQTLYNEFGSRDEFAQQYALREADRFLTEVETAVANNRDAPMLAVREGFLTFLRLAEENTMVRNIVVGDPGADELLSLFTTRGGPVVKLATLRLSDKFLELWPDAPPEDATMLAEGVARLAISFASLPTNTPDESAELAVRMLGPAIEQALGIEPASL